MDNPAELGLVILGFAVGTFGSMLGVGGGFVLVPILLVLFPDMPADELTSISLAVVMVNALSGSVAYARQRRTDFLSAAVLGAATLPGAIAGVFLVGVIPRRAFDTVFAAVLASAGLFILVRNPRRTMVEPVTGRWVVRRVVTDSIGQRFFYAYRLPTGIGISLAVGFVSSLLGIGGGIVHVPLMIWTLHFPAHIAAATAQAILGVTAAEGTVVHLLNGTLSEGDALRRAALLSLGTVPGAQLGAFVARRLRGPVITKILGASMLVVGARLALQAFDVL